MVRCIVVEMKNASSDPSPGLLRWLAEYACFPASRLPAAAETLLCFAAVAAAEAADEGQRFGVAGRDLAQTSAQRAHALRRSQVHFKCDNSAKV